MWYQMLLSIPLYLLQKKILRQDGDAYMCFFYFLKKIGKTVSPFLQHSFNHHPLSTTFYGSTTLYVIRLEVVLNQCLTGYFNH